ncbi:Serine/threonine-protein kinase [Trichostrongylus colubriformis]|uniref:Serine/threonine-protein kinase n=1 Tax=Trichostrongylus colubriformis TaxID=6319 RepID=A0AAN8FCS8_TRICO
MVAGSIVIASSLPNGKVIGKRWRIIKRLGVGGFGAVYKVKDINSNEFAALKVEGHRRHGNVLKLEVHILRRLAKCHLFATVLQEGKKTYYSYVVMTLLGASLDTLIGKHGRICTVSTQIRVGINALYGIKALHDMGFIHRDIKPANMALGTSNRSRIIHIFDFGLARQYVIFADRARPKLRRPRARARFRGTLRYCSINAQERGEQGRPDDLWNLLYMLTEMRGRLPWDDFELVKGCAGLIRLITRCKSRSTKSHDKEMN